MIDINTLEHVKILIEEKRFPTFEDYEIQFYLDRNNGDIDRTCHELLMLKATNTELVISGLTTKDQSKYFLRQAEKFRKNNSGVLS